MKPQLNLRFIHWLIDFIIKLNNLCCCKYPESNTHFKQQLLISQNAPTNKQTPLLCSPSPFPTVIGLHYSHLSLQSILLFSLVCYFPFFTYISLPPPQWILKCCWTHEIRKQLIMILILGCRSILILNLIFSILLSILSQKKPFCRINSHKKVSHTETAARTGGPLSRLSPLFGSIM